MKKKSFLTAAFLFVLFAINPFFAFAEDGVELDSAIQSAAQSIKDEIPAGAILGVTRFSSDTDELSQYLQTNIESALRRQGFSIVEKNEKNVKALNAEIDYQYNGNVADDYLVEIGKQVGAQYLVNGYFEQLGSYMSFYIRVTDIRTYESPVIETYAILQNTKLNELLGDAKNLETASDYLDAIARCKAKILSIQREKDKEITRVSNAISAKYQEQINAVNKWTQDPWESDEEFATRKSMEISAIETKRDTEIKGEKERLTILYTNQSRNVEISEREIKNKLEQTKFILTGEKQVSVFVGAFQKNAKPKHWLIDIKSLDDLVPYKVSAKHEINDADLRTEYNAFEEAKANNDIAGEITYSVIPSRSTEGDFDIIVIGYKVFNAETGSVYLNATVNANVGSVQAKTNVTKTQNKTTRKTSSTSSKKKVNRDDEDDSSVVSSRTDSAENATEAKEREPKEAKRRISDTFGVRYLLISDWRDYTLNGAAVNAFSSNFGHFFIDWVNAEAAFGNESQYFALSLDMGLWAGIGAFFPFVKAGAGFYNLEYKLDEHSSYDEVEWNDWEEDVSVTGFMAKAGIGTDIRFTDHVKLVASYDMHFLVGAWNMAADSFSVGLCFGKPVK